MTTQPPPVNCPSCSIPMTNGRMMVGNFFFQQPTGQTYKMFGMGRDIPAMETFTIQPYRCPKCGILQFYALETINLS